jgi:GNAT superfamily N-acetyltransferase
MEIRAAGIEDLARVFAYLGDQLTDNGANGTPLFQAMPRGQNVVPAATAASFTLGMETPVGNAGWRRLWIAVDDGGIAGHIDLRARPEGHAPHRVYLGMGVRRDVRRTGLGARLVEIAAAWAKDAGFSWIDLEVLSANLPARRLYERTGFVQIGEVKDMFRIDGESLDYTYMARALKN